ncbi:unnamed protein product [Acanthocheilonema viteae]|uniref:Uncharacterized protein n=1 Tax=Acanthocheilonema viteae TaxID=6277 RepID=A0A498S8R9_ACAVI|nr:unnamed protein product [Acanthocheilonema viteae]
MILGESNGILDGSIEIPYGSIEAPVKVAREIGIRFPNLPGFSSSMVRREAQMTASANAATSGTGMTSSSTTSAIVTSSTAPATELI